MKTTLYPADQRGETDLGWLESYHTFSFGGYYNPNAISFGALRVLNDDTVAPGMGFGLHPHKNMEIISIPLSGELEHQDSLQNKITIKAGEVQVMSAGTGVSHSEYNKSNHEKVHFLQIWIIPATTNVSPRYDQISLDPIKKENQLYQILSPYAHDSGVWIHQNAWFYMGSYHKTITETYTLHQPEKNGVFIFILDGEITINGKKLIKRDGMGIWDTDQIEYTAYAHAHILIMEIPMYVN